MFGVRRQHLFLSWVSNTLYLNIMSTFSASEQMPLAIISNISLNSCAFIWTFMKNWTGKVPFDSLGLLVTWMTIKMKRLITFISTSFQQRTHAHWPVNNFPSNLGDIFRDLDLYPKDVFDQLPEVERMFKHCTLPMTLDFSNIYLNHTVFQLVSCDKNLKWWKKLFQKERYSAITLVKHWTSTMS